MLQTLSLHLCTVKYLMVFLTDQLIQKCFIQVHFIFVLVQLNNFKNKEVGIQTAGGSTVVVSSEQLAY